MINKEDEYVKILVFFLILTKKDYLKEELLPHISLLGWEPISFLGDINSIQID